MSRLRIFDQDDPATPLVDTCDRITISEELSARQVRFEFWKASSPVQSGDSQEEILQAYRSDIDKLMAEEGYQTVDVVSLDSSHPQKEEMRKKFLNEHTHSEDEVRFFVDGCGLFSLHIGNQVVEVLCRKGDLISVPAETPHWFDMGPNPEFAAIRLLNNPEGWVANFTGNDIASRFPRLDN